MSDKATIRAIIAALSAPTFIAIAPQASAYEYCRRNMEYMLLCSFDNMTQCQATTSGYNGQCLHDPFLGRVSGAYAYAPSDYLPSQRKWGYLKATSTRRATSAD